LALFGRRLSERRDGLGMPASENLHKTGSSQPRAIFDLKRSVIFGETRKGAETVFF
jgi:hypothetical protein